jgi:hypothetical protein
MWRKKDNGKEEEKSETDATQRGLRRLQPLVRLRLPNKSDP